MRRPDEELDGSAEAEPAAGEGAGPELVTSDGPGADAGADAAVAGEQAMQPPPAGDVVALSRLIDEIRADVRWREAVAELKGRERAERPAEESEAGPPPIELELEVEPSGAWRQAPAPDETLGERIGSAEASVRAADAVVPLESSTPLAGELWARVRRQIHGEIRIYQDRQTAVNEQVLAALRRVEMLLDPAAPEGQVAPLWAAMEERFAALERRIARVEGAALEIARQVSRRDESAAARWERTRRRLDAVEGEIEELRQAADALAVELEPVSRLRAAVDDLERRLARPE